MKSFFTLFVSFSLSVTFFAWCVSSQSLENESEYVQRLSADYYAKKHRVSRKEALRRIGIQDASSGIEDDLAELLGDDFAGIWFDANRSGRIGIGLVRSARPKLADIRQLMDKYKVANVTDIVPVRYSIADLERIERSIQTDVDPMVANGHARMTYNTKNNRVTVRALNKVSPAEERILRRLATVSGVVVTRSAARSLTATFNSCLVRKCDPPFRGGREISSGGLCTSAFIGHVTNDPGVSLVITAGHCLFGGGGIGKTWSATPETSPSSAIGKAIGFVFAGSIGEDEGIIKIDHTGFWDTPSPLAALIVKVDPTGITTLDTSYGIARTSFSSIGQVLCRTGRSTGTECGEVEELGAEVSANLTNLGTFTVKNQGVLDICGSQGGDSGGPIYKRHRAFGIFNSTEDAGILDCDEFYQGIRGAEKTLNMTVDTQ